MAWNPAKLDTQWPFDLYATKFKLSRPSTALLVIDMQTADLRFDAKSVVARRYPAIARYWNKRIDSIVLPNITKLIERFRAARRSTLKIIYTRNGALTSTGHELAPRLRPRSRKRGAACVTPTSDIDPRLAPRPEDLVITKLTSGAFIATPLDHALRNMGVKSVVIAGILTDMCVLGTARVAAELGYNSVLCEDACATLTPRAHDEALLMHARVFGRVSSVRDVLKELRLGKS